MVVIVSASYGDEYSKTDITDSLKSKLKNDGLSVRVDSSLLPVRTTIVGADQTLTPAEQQQARARAIEQCGSAGNTDCVQQRTRAFAEQRLKEKELETLGKGNQIAGRAATVDFRESPNGPLRRAVVAEGQMFEVGKLTQKTPPQSFDVDSLTSSWLPSWTTIVATLGGSIALFLYVSSIIITWMTFRVEDSRWMTMAMTAIAVVLPYSGFVLVLLRGMFPELLRQWSFRRAEYAQKRLALS